MNKDYQSRLEEYKRQLKYIDDNLPHVTEWSEKHHLEQARVHLKILIGDAVMFFGDKHKKGK